MGRSKANRAIPAEKRAEIISRQQWLDFAYKLASALIKFGALAFGLWQTRLAIEGLAHGATTVDLLVTWLGDGLVSCTVSFGFGAAGVGYGLWERGEKRRKTVTLTERNRALELKLDPNRSSSHLEPDGRTNPRDAL
ncbi:MAG: hypothetical protein HY985_09755 [Magnetospirillum sp.]|nr:hypothetical protein [Magnetospirillum sp.]